MSHRFQVCELRVDARALGSIVSIEHCACFHWSFLVSMAVKPPVSSSRAQQDSQIVSIELRTSNSQAGTEPGPTVWPASSSLELGVGLCDLCLSYPYTWALGATQALLLGPTLGAGRPLCAAHAYITPISHIGPPKRKFSLLFPPNSERRSRPCSTIWTYSHYSPSSAPL